MAYYRGDYYVGHGRGDYYKSRGGKAAMRSFGYHGYRRGDPFWGKLLKGLGSVATSALGISKAPSAAEVAKAVVEQLPSGPAAIFPGAPGSVPNMIPVSRNLPALPPSPMPGLLQRAALRPGRPLAITPPLEASMLNLRRRRMNPGNVKALRRSIRRICSFGKLVTSVKGTIRKAANEVAPVHHRTAIARRK